MTYREFAERTLLSTDLKEKLAAPLGDLVDEAPGGAFITPDAPGRPENLRFMAAGDKNPRPKAHLLADDLDRAHLLHLFANHELLATELMALALLKFPDAPAEFRRGLMRTLREEQKHTQWYQERLVALGVEFGSLPVNGFFWRCISDMPTPLDYVSRLSLTFEQANLDYSRYFDQRFAEAGDLPTSVILSRIYKDEIAHVGYGLKWFRRWKGVDTEDWQAYREILPYPLTPARAKGNVVFNAAGRRKAGLEEAFIAQLELYSHSRGRTPWVYFFNPGAELCAAARDASVCLGDPVGDTLARDLEPALLLMAQTDDVVLLREAPRAEFLRYWLENGIELPEREILDKNGQLVSNSTLLSRKIGKLRPWGWSADSARSMENLVPCLTNGAEASTALPWHEGVRTLYSKKTGLGIYEHLEWDAGFGLPDIVGKAAADLPDTMALLEHWWAEGQRCVVKGNFGLAGRSMGRFGPEYAVKLSQNAASRLRALHEGGEGTVVEPWLDRVIDFSAQYEIDSPGALPRLKGFVRLHCAESGRYQACTVGAPLGRLLPPEAARFSQSQGRNWLKILYGEKLPRGLQAWLGQTGFYGMLGVDAFFYRRTDGSVRLKPVVEINPRCTMGRLTLELLRHAAPNVPLTLQHFSQNALAKGGLGTLKSFHKELLESHPIRRTPQGITSGALFLNDLSTARQFLGVAHYGRLDPWPMA